MERKIEERIDLYFEIYQKALEKASKANPNNARYIADEIFKEIARDLRSELISQLRKENGKNTEVKTEGIVEPRENGKVNGNGDRSKEENSKPATENQRYALHKFGIENVPESLTKKVACEILNSLVCLSKQRDRGGIKEIVERLNAMDEWRAEKGKQASPFKTVL